jgi:hypothetical protein
MLSTVPVEGRSRDPKKKSTTVVTRKIAKPTKEAALTPAVSDPESVAPPDTGTTPSETSEESSSSSVEAVPQGSANSEWEFSVDPYFFLAGLEGTIGVAPRTVEVRDSFRDLFSNLDFALMGQFEAHKGNWSILADAMYVSLSGERVTPNPLFGDIAVEVKETIIEPAVAYRVLRAERGWIDLVGGVRFWRVKPHLTFQPRILPLVDIEESKSWADPTIGARGTASLSPRVFVVGRFDIGGFGVSSDFTGQAFGGVGFQIKPRVALVGGYRYLRVDYSNEGFIFRTALSGIILGAKFKL